MIKTPQHYYPDYDIGLWTFCASVFGGSFGVFAGGFFSDRLVKVVGMMMMVVVVIRKMTIMMKIHDYQSGSWTSLQALAPVCLHSSGITTDDNEWRR